jgi:hypothetical protein
MDRRLERTKPLFVKKSTQESPQCIDKSPTLAVLTEPREKNYELPGKLSLSGLARLSKKSSPYFFIHWESIGSFFFPCTRV